MFIHSGKKIRLKRLKMAGKGNRKMTKTWIVFFDENGRDHCGSEWNHGFNLLAHNAEKRILSKDYTKPAGAVGYLVLSHNQFMSYDYETIENLYKRYGRAL